MPEVISFPHMGDYCAPISRLLSSVFPNDEVCCAPRTTVRTLEKGSLMSPERVCAPFKYTMGNFIEALDAGATVLLQTGLGCRYGYYAELQERLLRDMGYTFTFMNLSRSNAKLLTVYRRCVSLGSPMSLLGFLRALMTALLSIWTLDCFAYRLRERAAFDDKGVLERLYGELLSDVENARTIYAAMRVAKKYLPRGRFGVKIPPSALRVGIVGELFTLMEPFSNYYLEKRLAQSGISVSRRMSVSFLIGRRNGRSLKKSEGYAAYPIGANGIDSVAQSLHYAQKGYDGIIHMKSFGCTPEVNAMPILHAIAEEYHIPMLHLSFDGQSSELGVETRLEAFIDMLEMRRSKEHASVFGSGYRLHFDQSRRH